MLKGLKTDVIIHSRGLNMKTVKQLASELKISKTYLMRTIDNNGLRSSLQKVGNKFLIDKDTEKAILKALNKISEEKTQTESKTENNNLQPVVSDSVVDFLQEQLRMKDKQIEELHRLLNQEQQLNAKNTQKIELLENKQEEYQKSWFGLYRKVK